MDLYGIVCMDFCMDMYRDTCFEVWNTSFCIECLFEIVVWFDCGPQWRKKFYLENVEF